MDILSCSTLPQIVGLAEIPESMGRKPPKKAKAPAAGRNADRPAIVRDALSILQPGRAVAVQCPSKDEIQTFRCHVLVMARGRVKTAARGMTLYIYEKPEQLSFLEACHD